jgi:hypothetical protein
MIKSGSISNSVIEDKEGPTLHPVRGNKKNDRR